ncbi:MULTISPECIES: glycosyltransferase family 4 protein [unclassified Nitratiruptor]|uniref:glycosyltransferase family 4 protein n=1 Tax=unclassified Nitratiruptor TaxID=2624044 RepID=UPI00191596F0|nr:MULTISPECIES: glycosyltransferase [unclassified Nitratiruptor]BCD60700.1 hypothetical protein NitYY0810_C1478 [Nitratiruptor sp. YY08-10]BCD64633.1 hypothetical protein NitYY0814_C1487 [Nitratiruptor sp. YY08-14]
MIALIIHRFDKDIVGGAEQYAYELAKIIALQKEIEIITTTAVDHTTWENFYEPGVYEDDFIIRRFQVDIQRSLYWERLHSLALTKNPSTLPVSFCEEWIKRQGPYSSSLLNFLKKSHYEKYIFVTYLYPTTYFGIDLVENAYLLSTYHDEVPFYFPIFKKYARYKHLFLTSEEKSLAIEHIKPTSYEILGFGIKEKCLPLSSQEKYFLYAGRIEPSKGIDVLAKFYERFYKKHKIPLYVIGKGDESLIKKRGIVYKGFVTEEEKLNYMKNAIAFIHPSPHESLGIVLLESFSQSTPALVTSKSRVLTDHITLSKGGKSYTNYEEFEKNLLEIKKNRSFYANNAYRYFKKNYDYEIFKNKILHIF